MPATHEDVVTCLQRMADVIEENKRYLTKLDSPIGDADHGVNMNRGFKAVLNKIGSMEDADPGSLLKTTGTALVSSVGGALGAMSYDWIVTPGLPEPE